ncbi:type IV toxin-antitoxin system AbiEi family antitoxin domain-containing protein [Aeromicrobium sp. CnD17-E]|uniref:type IV toxin-antitoxin system AbiEi family antitoxin domain-containing protein n=1 Tax=Aeromicrobium sp. CnD17-E TaxID=2954487 RepID=UPI002097E262|nr:type IV toxin-antitoxin system AbiEi family antitoxin domain-containing protein [Aeromicrobium sp. CnD17-E]MCO7240600.1 type IV toxin-antitoxin system AbiEi family antitoxin domain-containing protein [Aeromicrobium sp. CnD17-E]
MGVFVHRRAARSTKVAGSSTGCLRGLLLQPEKVFLGRMTHDELAALAHHHGGYLLTRHLLELGLSQRRISSLAREGVLARPRHGTYVPRGLWEHADAVQKHAILTRSVLERADDGAVATHQSAAALLGLDLWGTDLSLIHLARTDKRSGRHIAGVVWHEPDLRTDDVTMAAGVPTVLPSIAALQIAAFTGVEQGVVALSSVLRARGTSEVELAEQVSRFRSWAGAETVRQTVQLADGRLESAGEARSFVMFWRHGTDLPELQVVIVDAHGRKVGRVDFEWTADRHVGEFDGLVKYGRSNQHRRDPGMGIVEEKLREDEVRDTWRGVSRWGWVDLHWSNQATTVARIEAARARSRRLYLPVA